MKRTLTAVTLLSFVALPATALAKTVKVDATDFKFSPKTAKVHARDKVKWTSSEGDHDVTFKKSFGINFSERINEGESTSFKFTAPGTYKYVCKIHRSQGMKGKVAVR